MPTRRIPEARVEANEAIEIRVVGVEMPCFMECVVVFYKRGDFESVGEPVFDNGAEGIEGGTFGEGELFFAADHGFGADEV